MLLGQASPDWRDIRNGHVIPDEGYSDQPYVVITRDGNWLCVMTTGAGVEGQMGQHVVATISKDKGTTWSKLADIEPAKGPEASWAMPFLTPWGRVYVFYTYNQDNVRSVPSNNPDIGKRVDTLGAYVYKFSDDNGHTWSRRYLIPIRKMRIDRENSTKGKVLFFWGVGKPVVHKGAMIFGFAKVGRWGDPGAMIESQGCFLRSPNILSERDPEKIRWELLPDGDEGLRAPKGPVSDEANLVSMNDGSLYATYRTIDGYNCQAYSRDGGHTWTPPAYATYGPNGRRLKHPRAANFVRKFSNGKYLLWYHNHGGEAAVSQEHWRYYTGRNPAWVSGGIERDGHIYWSEPEILLYDTDPNVRISYPDFIEDGERYFVTETQKTVAQVHEIDRKLLETLWAQAGNRALVRGITLQEGGAMPAVEADGFTIDFWMNLRELTDGQTVLDSRDEAGRGIAIATSKRFSLKLSLNDGRRETTWESDAGTHDGTLKVNRWQHVAVTVDGRARVITWVVDGVLNDGGAVRDYGWGRLEADLSALNAPVRLRIASPLIGEVRRLQYHSRPLLTSEAVGNFRAGPPVE